MGSDWFLELASVLAGPSVGQFFAELGAEVIKVENPLTGGDVTRSWKTSGEETDDRSAYFCSCNWGKKSVLLNLASNAVVQPSLGRPLSASAPNATVNLVEPGTLYGEQTNLLDLRLSKILRFNKYRTAVNLDLANLFNSSGITSINNNYATWQVPTGIHQARIVKISVNFDF